MARTKKQTLVNACERRRQIQEEIRRETLAAKQKRENNSSSVHVNSAHNGVPISNVQIVSRQEKLDDGTDMSSSSDRQVFDLNQASSSVSQASMSGNDTSLFNEGNLPKAVICIPDICRSPTKLAAEEPGLQEHNSKGQGLWGKASFSSHDFSVKSREDSFRKCGSSKQSDKNADDVIASLRSLKAVSEKVREEKSRKYRQVSSTASQTPVSGRRSPRQGSLASSDALQVASRKGFKDTQPVSDEKPKVNIFTDNLGKDLGKRIRSPRRLSEDMIALPIFSARRWSNSPKENSAASITGGRAADEICIYDGMETLSLYTVQSSDSVKPNGSPTTYKKSSSYESPQKTPPPGSSKIHLLDEMGSTGTKCSALPHKQHNRKSGEGSPLMGTSSAADNYEKLFCQEIKTEAVCEDIIQPCSSKYAKSLILNERSCDKLTKKPVPAGNSSLSSIVNSKSGHASIADNDSLRKLKNTDTTPTSCQAKEDWSKQTMHKGIESHNSSICKELMSDGVLIKSENRCLNDAVDSFFNVKADIFLAKDSVCQVKKGIVAEKKVSVSNSSSSSSDTDKEISRNKSPRAQTPGLPVSLDTAEEKPQSSLLCAMLVGGTEVAHSYSQERVRVKSQGGDKSDSEVDILKCDPAKVVSKTSLPHPPTVSPDVMNQTQTSSHHKVDIDQSDSQVLPGVVKSEVLFHCDETTTGEHQHAESITCDIAANVKADVSDTTDEIKTSVARKGPLNLSFQLKKLNESVLKLLDIDVEDEFLKELEIDDSSNEGNIHSQQSDTSPHKELHQTALYSLIYSLGNRLQCTESQSPFSTPVDIELVGKLIESCPKYAPSVMPRLKTLARKVCLNKRLAEDIMKEMNSNHIRTNDKLTIEGDKNNCGSEDSHQNSSTATSDDAVCVPNLIASSNNQKGHSYAGPDSLSMQALTLESMSLHSADVSQNVNDSIDVNVDAKEYNKTSFVPLGSQEDKNILQKFSDILQASTNKKLLPDDISTGKLSEIPSRLSFQKSKTCDDFNNRILEHPTSNVGALRRVNSSPQINTKSVVTPSCFSSPVNGTTKDGQTKSKLGSKIPVPGTSYSVKSKKSWRTPRTVAEPKPLSILLELEQTSLQSTSAFTSSDLQKYLNVPSNRVIVTSDKRDEMEILDAKAKLEEEENEKRMQGNDNSIEDDINSDYKNCEPDFDEVDGMLFMSFYSEIELQAHVRVEKALEWDKDDTMLRVSRAKAFEEAKAQNEDMGHVKLKHLRGQHMRWKKYRRMYSIEVKALLEAQNNGQPNNSLPVPKKTSDLSKIKGSKRKITSMPEVGSDVNDNWSWPCDTRSNSFSEHRKDLTQGSNQAMFDDSVLPHMFDDSMYFMSENIPTEDGDKLDMLPRTRRRQGFSHQKAHRQLFRELNMDWEDRMIHRKLGGWSLKGNRPQAFSSAAKKRQEQKSKESDLAGFEFRDINIEACPFEEIELEIADSKDHSEDSKKKKTIKIIYPLLTEKMARNALKTLETGDIHREARKQKKKSRQSHQLPALTPLVCKSEPEDEMPLSDSASFILSSVTPLLTPSATSSVISLSSPSTSVATVPLEIDLQDEPVMEGVDIAAENISSPSVTDTASLKSCGKPGCRYGCICHLCSVNESSVPLPSPLSRQPVPVCDKEYCRLGCICDSIDPERPISNKTHCRRPSCMLQCICLESGSFDASEDIPYLPSMRRRPKPGDRFSNLPQREKTHRSAKNLDAVTRKALMLYETSEIYCERVERGRKRSEISSSASSFDSSSLGYSLAHAGATSTSASIDLDIVSEPSEDSSYQPDTFISDLPVTSEGATLTSLQPVITCITSPQHQHMTRNSTTRVAKPVFVLDDVRQIVSIVEPSAHKRKRKSHPLSDEIFISSTCARTQPFKHLSSSKGNRISLSSKDPEEIIELFPSVSADLASPITSSAIMPVSSKSVELKVTEGSNESEHTVLKMASAHTEASEKSPDLNPQNTVESETSQSHSVVVSPDSVSHQKWKSMTSPQQASTQNCASNSNFQGNARQFHGWHKSMVCLKARAPPSSQDQAEDDVKEEDEVKLLEFAANCNWEGAKREILAKVAQCLTRGQYPQPRTMNVCEFVVEILPKAHQPSHIPAELRAKLPGQMYSIRVRITRRESVSKKEDDNVVIDLSGSSPVKSRIVNDKTDLSLKESPSLSACQKPSKNSADPSFLASSSLGISGLSKLHITNTPTSAQNQNSSNDILTVHSSSQPTDAQNIRRQSLDSATVISSPDYKQTADYRTITVQTSPISGNRPKSASFLRFGNAVSPKTIGSAFSSETIKTVTSTMVSSPLKTVTSNSSSKRGGVKPVNISTTSQPFVSKSVTSGVTPIFGPFSAKDVKYVMPGRDGTMQLIEIGPAGDKNKKLIAVPITLSKTPVDLKGKQGAVVALPVSGMGPSRLLPVLSPPAATNQLKGSATQQIVLRLPATTQATAASAAGVRHPVVLQPLQNSLKCRPPRFQVVPLQVGNCMPIPQTKGAPTAVTPSCAVTNVTQKPGSNSDEMIMVFDAAHIKASTTPSLSGNCTASVVKDKGQENTSIDHCPSATLSNDKVGVSATDYTIKEENKTDATIDPATEKVPFEEEEATAEIISENSINDKDNITSTSADLTNNIGLTGLRGGVESAPHEDSNRTPETNQTDVFLEINLQSTGTQLPVDKQVLEVSTEAEVSLSSSAVTHSNLTVRENSLNQDSLARDTLIEATTNSRIKPALRPRSPIVAKEHIPKSLQEYAQTGSKRHISAVMAIDEPLSPATKKPYLGVENPIVLDEDSIASLNSISGIQQAAPSPMSSLGRPKSVMSGALSTGSSEDMLILLSSEEDIDVGEDDRPDDIISYRVRMERALENDHGSMYTRADTAVGVLYNDMKKTQSSDEGVKYNGVRHDEKDLTRPSGREHLLRHIGRDLKKVNHHNQLERLRRSRMKILFDELQQYVLQERGLPNDHAMSKVKVLVEAKKVVLHLNKCVLEGNELVKRFEKKNRFLRKKLSTLKANLMKSNVSAQTISSVIHKASEKFFVQNVSPSVTQAPEFKQVQSPSSETMHSVTIDVEVDDSEETVNLVSPSTDGEKASERPDVITPVYEDISDPEDESAHKYEDISDTEEPTRGAGLCGSGAVV